MTVGGAVRAPRRAPGRASRRRGSSFTLVVVATSILILMTAALFVDASRLAFLRSVAETRRTSLREGAFAGVTWAARDAAASPEAAAGGPAMIALGGGLDVEVSWERVDAGLVVTSRARSFEGQEITLEARLEPDGDGYTLRDLAVDRRGFERLAREDGEEPTPGEPTPEGPTPEEPPSGDF